MAWLDRHPASRFAILLNYGEPTWPLGADRAAIYANFRRYQSRFVGFVSGEAVVHGTVDSAALEKKVRAAASRAEVLAALREVYSDSVVKKFSDYYGMPVSAHDAWGIVSRESAPTRAVPSVSHATGGSTRWFASTTRPDSGPATCTI
jgi:hypothetical protein